MITCIAPTRIDIAGPWVDIDQWTENRIGATCNAAISVFANAEISTRPRILGPTGQLDNDIVTLINGDEGITFSARIGKIHQIEVDSCFSLAQSAIRRLGVSKGIKITTSSEAPPGCGLGTSSAMAIVIIKVISSLFRMEMSEKGMIDLARKIETEDLKIHGGWQDYYAAAYGGFGYMVWEADFQRHEYIPVSDDLIQKLQARSILAYSGESRLSSDIHVLVHKALEKNIKVWDAFSDMATQALWAKEALENGNIKLLAEIMNESWECQKILHESVTNLKIDQIMKIAKDNGAIGGKACGAGGGGCLYFITKDGAKEKVEKALLEALPSINKEAKIIPFEFCPHGARVIN